MPPLGYLLVAFIVVWALVFGYVFWLITRERKLRREIESLKEKPKRKGH